MGRRRRRLVLLAVVALLGAACSGAEDPSSPPAATATTRPGDPGVGDDREPVEVGDPADLAGLPGRIAVVRGNGLEVATPTGERTPLISGCLESLQFVALAGDGRSCPDQLVTQPTWAPGGRRLAASVIDGVDPARSAVVLADVREAAVEVLRTTDRPPFFYSWRDDGERLASLGPGPQGGTSLTLLDPDGTARPDVAQASGVYVAWEPAGADLVAHDGDDLQLFAGTSGDLLVDDLGRAFPTPAWVPGTRRVLVATGGQDPALALLDVDTGRRQAVARLDGPVRFALHPDGDRVAVDHEQPAGADSERTAAVELIDLATGTRTPVLDQSAVWMEWSPDGDRLLVLTVAPGEATWHVRQPDGEVVEAATYQPSRTEVVNHLPYYDQYTESPRRWSPDGRAFVFSGEIGDRSGVWVQPVDPVAPVVPLGPGRIAWWSPR